ANNEHDDIRPYCGNCNSTSLMTFARRSRRTQQRTPPPSPLDLPEVLELVLSHLSQYSLNHRARLVSKFWNSTSLRLIHRTLTWSDQINIPEQQRILDQVGYTSILRITTRVPHLPRSLHFEDVAWGNLYGAYKPRLRQLPTPPRLGSTRIPMVLEQLVIEGILNMNRRLQPLWPLIPSVRTIRIKTVHKNDYHIEIILRSCSNLTELLLEPVGVFAFPIQYMARLAKPPSLASEEAGIDPSEPPLPILRLTSLVMMHMIVEESYLIPILKKCPSLKELRVDGMQRAQNVWMNNLSIGGVTAAGSQASLHQQRQEFFKDLASWCPRLESLHLSHRDLFLTPADTTTVFSVFSRLSTISLATRDVCGPILDILLPPNPSSRLGITIASLPKVPRVSSNFITFLEIVRPPAYYDEAMLSKVLHTYLCNAPHLLTLRAEHILFYLEHMDVRPHSNRDKYDVDISAPRSHFYSMDYIDRDSNAIGLAGAGPTTTSEYHSNLASWTRARLQHSTALAGSGTSSPHPTVLNPKLIWACRNLQTLHLSFQARMGDSDNAEQNRIIFGYIGRVCPRLRELVLFRSLMRLSLDGGLCLLTRLVDLERLTVGARVPCKMSDKDFSWLARPVKDASLKTAGQGLRQEAAASGSTTPWTKALHSLLFGKTKKPESAADQEMALRTLLKHLGTSRDVREVLEEKDQDPGGCWPRLEELTIHFSEPLQSDPVDLQKIVAKYRPEIQALDHPEILERIFGYLSQCTLRTNVRLVCVHWNNVTRPLITLTVWWYNNNEPTHDLFPLHSFFNKLSLEFHPFTLHDQLEIKHFQEGEPSVQKRWTALYENVQTLAQQGQLHFRILKVSHPYKIKDRLLPLLDILASVLTELDFYLVQDIVIHLGPIMETCHHLKTLLVEGSKSDKHPYGMATLLKDRDPSHVNNHGSSSGHDSDLQETSRYITRVCISHVRVHQLDLEAIIRRCPNLWVLGLEVAIYPRTTRPEDTFFPSSSSAFVYNPIIAPPVDPKPLIHFVRAHCLHLARFLCIPLNQTRSSM
ncbi:hypothetical protein BGZ59_000959, partial [Podila verticillata]